MGDNLPTHLCLAKYNENEEHVPELVSLQSITQQEIPREELLKYELWALQRMGWILCGKYLSVFHCISVFYNYYFIARTVPAFLSCYRFLGSIFEADIGALAIAQGKSPPCTEVLQSEVDRLGALAHKQCSALATMTALDSRFKPFPCSLVAAAVLYVSRRCLGLPLDDVWPTDLVVMTRYSVEDITSLVHMIDRASEEITRWVQSGTNGTVPTTPAKVGSSVTSIHPSKSAAESNIRSGKMSLKYSVDSEEAQAALKKVAMEEAGVNDNFSPVSIAEQFEGQRKVDGKFSSTRVMSAHVLVQNSA